MKSLICEWVTCRPAKELVLSKEKPIPYQPPLPPNEVLSAVDAAAGVTPVGLRPPFITPAAAHSHPDCRGILILIVALDRGAAGRHGGPDADPGLLAAVAEEVQLFRSLARDGPPLGAGVEAADVRADRRDRGGADLRAAGRDRRGAQLGLSLYLGARRRFHQLRLPAPGADVGGRAVHGLVGAAGRRGRPGRPIADYVSHRRRARAARGGPRPPRWLPRLASGASRQRRCRAAAAGHLWRADGRRLPVRQVRDADRL